MLRNNRRMWTGQADRSDSWTKRCQSLEVNVRRGKGRPRKSRMMPSQRIYGPVISTLKKQKTGTTGEGSCVLPVVKSNPTQGKKDSKYMIIIENTSLISHDAQ